MKLNIKKCKVLSLHGIRQEPVSYNYGLDNLSLLERVNSMKDLGVTISCNLSFRNHIYEKINTAYKMLGIIKRNFNAVDTFTFITLYKSFVRSQLEYANSIWNPCTSGIIHDIEKVQKRATKYIKACKDLSYKHRLIHLQLPTLKYRRLRGDMIQVYKILRNLYEQSTVPNLPRNADLRTRGNSLKLLVERCRLDTRRFSFCSRVVKHWNSLPDSVVNSDSLNCFKVNIDKHFKCTNTYFDFEADL